MFYHIETLTKDELREIIRNGDDRVHNQIRVRLNGEVFLSRDVGGANLKGIAITYGTFGAGNDYVGEDAANDDYHINDIYNAIRSEWGIEGAKNFGYGITNSLMHRKVA